MPAKVDRCVRKVKAKMRKGGKKVNPWAVCRAAQNKKKRRKKKK